MIGGSFLKFFGVVRICDRLVMFSIGRALDGVWVCIFVVFELIFGRGVGSVKGIGGIELFGFKFRGFGELRYVFEERGIKNWSLNFMEDRERGNNYIIIMIY